MKLSFTDGAKADWRWWQQRAREAPDTLGVQFVEMAHMVGHLPFGGHASRWAPGKMELVTKRIRLLYSVDAEAGIITVEAVVDTRMAPATVLRRLG